MCNLKQDNKISKSDIEWLQNNYFESIDECKKLIYKATELYVFTQEQFIEGCKEIKKGEFEKRSLWPHLKILGEMSVYGIKANIAGKKFRESLIESFNG
jgi:hypothetical protein